MSEPLITAVAIRTEPVRAWSVGLAQAVGNGFVRTGVWAADTAAHFGTLLSALMGPAVFCAYAFSFWSLAANLGWVDTFPYVSGPLSNWFMWLGIAILVHLAAGVLKRHTRTER